MAWAGERRGRGDGGEPVSGARDWLEEVERLDVACYAAIASTSTPRLEPAMGPPSAGAGYARPSRPAPRRLAAVAGMTSVAVTATVVNVAVKPLARRRRPDRLAHEVPIARQVPMPSSRSFPSGHAAAAFAFAGGAGAVVPAVSLPLHALAGLVAYSRIHTGVHYPLDAIADSVLGAALSQTTRRL